MYRFGWGSMLALSVMLLLTVAHANSDVPIASTVQLEMSDVSAGAVVRYSESGDMFALSRGARDEAVYGVVNERPPLVFVTATTAVPVVTEGVTAVQVTLENGAIARGDVLTTASSTGQAMRADLNDTAVFAVALEATDVPGAIMADVGVERAQAVQRERRAETSGLGALSEDQVVSTTRAVLAAVVVLGALGFLLYSYRSVMANSVRSIGRNPRAKRSLVFAGVGSMVLVVLVSLVIIFIAIGILVLPV